MADSRIIIEIAGKDSASGVFKSTQQNIAGSVRSMEVSVSDSLSGITSRWGQFLSVFAVAQGARGLLDTATEIESITNKLKASVGGTEEAASAWRFLQAESDKLGLNLKTSADQFGSFAAAARGTKMEGEGVRQVFLAVAQASAVMGLSDEKSAMAMTALTQMISKGKVSSEELRRQLGEHIPGAFQIAARAMNMTTAELDKFITNGALASDVFLPKFAAQLSKEMGGGLDAASMSMRANINRLSNAWLGLKTSLVQGGFGSAATGMILDLTDSLKRLSDQIKGSTDVPIFFKNLADSGKAIGSIAVPALAGFVATLGNLARAYNELPEVFKTGTGTGLIAIMLTKSAPLAVGTGTFAVLNQSMEQLNQQMNVDMMPTLQHGERQWNSFSRAVYNVIDALTGKRDWNTGVLRALNFGDFRKLENQSVGTDTRGKVLDMGLSALIDQLDAIQKRRAALSTDPLGRIASGNADADATNRAKAAVDARTASEERINRLLEERDQIQAGGADQGALQQDLAEATQYFNTLQRIIADIKQSGTSFKYGFDRSDLQDLMAESADVKAFMDDTSASLRDMSGQYSQQASFLVERAIYEERATLAVRQRQEQETQWLAVTSQIAELQKNLQGGNVNDSKVQADITALLKTQTTETQKLADLQTKRADAARQMDSATNVDKWREMRDVVASLDEQIGYADERVRRVGDALRSVPNKVSVELSMEEETARKKYENLLSMFDQLRQQVTVNLSTDKANDQLDLLIRKLDYLQKMGGSSYMIAFEGTGSPSMSFSDYYNYLLDKLANLPKGSQYTVDFLTQQGGMTSTGAVSATQQYSKLQSLQQSLSEAQQLFQYYSLHPPTQYTSIFANPMADHYQNVIIPELVSRIQEANLAMMSSVASGQVSSGGGSGGSSVEGNNNVSVNINSINVTVPDSSNARDFAISVGVALDGQLANAYKQGRLPQFRAAIEGN